MDNNLRKITDPKISVGGYASFYLNTLKLESKSDDDIDIEIFINLMKLDSKFGKTVTEHLFESLQWTLRFDIIKVIIQLGR